MRRMKEADAMELFASVAQYLLMIIKRMNYYLMDIQTGFI